MPFEISSIGSKEQETNAKVITSAKFTVDDGQSIIVVVGCETVAVDPTMVSWKPTGGSPESFTKVVGKGASSCDISIWYITAPTGGSGDITVTWTSLGDFTAASMVYYICDNLDTSDVVEASNPSNGSATTYYGGAFTTIDPECLVVLGVVTATTPGMSSIPSGYTHQYDSTASGHFTSSWRMDVFHSLQETGAYTIAFGYYSVAAVWNGVCAAFNRGTVNFSGSTTITLNDEESPAGSTYERTLEETIAVFDSLNPAGSLYGREFDQSVNISDDTSQINQILNKTYTDAVTISDEWHRAYEDSVSNSFSLVGSMARGDNFDGALTISQTLTLVSARGFDGLVTLTDGFTINQTLHKEFSSTVAVADAGIYNDGTRTWNYSPQFSLGQAGRTPKAPGDIIFQVTPAGDFELDGLGDPITVRNPLFGDQYLINKYGAINVTRSLQVKGWRKNSGPKKYNFRFTIPLLCVEDFDALVDWVENNIGLEVTITDHDAFTWTGVILNPEQANPQPGRSYWTVSFDIRGTYEEPE